MSAARYSVVVPVYNNADTLPALVERLITLAAAKAETGVLEAVFVVDGSPDDSLAVLERVLAAGTLPARVVPLTRNFGAFSAVRLGLTQTSGDYIAVIAADLQEPPELLDGFFTMMETGQADIVLGRRTARDDPALTTLMSRAYWALHRRFINPDIPVGGVDVFGLTREVADVVSGFTEANTSLVGLLYWVGYRRGYVDYQRAPRHHGKSSWTVRKKVRYLTDSVFSFTDLPIMVLTAAGFLGVLGSLLLAAIILGAWLAGLITVPGYTAIMVVLLGSVSMLLFGLGVVGSYVWRMFDNARRRPYALARPPHEYGQETRNT